MEASNLSVTTSEMYNKSARDLTEDGENYCRQFAESTEKQLMNSD